MQEKMKMILQKDENLVHIQQQYSVSFCEKIDSKSGFFQQIWHYQCLIFMILIRTKYLENSLRDSSLSQYSIAKIHFIPGSLDNSKMPFEQLFLDDPLSGNQKIKVSKGIFEMTPQNQAVFCDGKQKTKYHLRASFQDVQLLLKSSK